MVIELKKVGEEVFYQDTKLPLVDKAKECGPSVDLDKLGFVGYQRYVKVSRLEEGLNQIELKPSKAALTEEELARIAELQAEIDAIKENARQRAKIAKPAKPTKLEKMSPEQLKEEIARCNALLAKLENKSEVE
jgi:hypothetical protein